MRFAEGRKRNGGCSDCRNVLRATIEVPKAGEVNFHCTHLDHLDESWRMKQVSTMLRSLDGPHILAGGLNALDGTDYSAERWADIVKVPTHFVFFLQTENIRSLCLVLTLFWLQYYEEIGKPTPKVEVMKYLKGKQFVDAKDFAGECEAVVVVAKGQGEADMPHFSHDVFCLLFTQYYSGTELRTLH